MDLISVIVPVYHVEKYLDKCVQSIVDQTYQNLEIILVDDGSPDNWPAMCDAWAAWDSRIKVIHKPNGGGAQARNVGLDHATGSYICFVDSDDYILPDMFGYLLELLLTTESQIAECGYWLVHTDEAPCCGNDTNSISVYTTEDALRENIRDHVCRQLVWNKLYLRQVLDGVRFVEEKFIDDEFFTYRAIAKTKKIAVTTKHLYCYRQQTQSAMHQKYSLKWLQAIEAKEVRISFFHDRFPALVPEARQNLWFSCLYQGQQALLHLNGDDRTAALARLREVLRKYPLTNADLRALPGKRRIWPILARADFVFVCKLRNLLKKGI